MTDLTDEYMPYKEEGDERLHVVQINFCIDWGGRQAQVEFQTMSSLKTVEATYFYKSMDYHVLDVPGGRVAVFAA